jgi:hypothetical protein
MFVATNKILNFEEMYDFINLLNIVHHRFFKILLCPLNFICEHLPMTQVIQIAVIRNTRAIL